MHLCGHSRCLEDVGQAREATHASINDNIGAADDPVTKELFAFVAEVLKR